MSSGVNLSNFTIPLVLPNSDLAEKIIPKVSDIESLSQISANQPPQTLFLFDIDDTIIDSFSMVGSKAWRKYFAEATKKIDSSANWHDIFSYFLAQKNPLKAVEGITSSFVKGLQNQRYVVCALTSRERNKWYKMPREGIDSLTAKQLSSVDVNFNNRSLEETYPDLATNSEYYNGIFFANKAPKGNYLLELFERTSRHPKKIVFVDDKRDQVQSVANALTKMGIPHECYLYSATDKKGEVFNPLIANIQLYYFYKSYGKEIISDEEGDSIAKKNPENDADYYLKSILNLAKERIK